MPYWRLRRGDSEVSEYISDVNGRGEEEPGRRVYYDHAPSGGEVLWDWAKQDGLDETTK